MTSLSGHIPTPDWEEEEIGVFPMATPSFPGCNTFPSRSVVTHIHMHWYVVENGRWNNLKLYLSEKKEGKDKKWGGGRKEGKIRSSSRDVALEVQVHFSHTLFMNGRPLYFLFFAYFFLCFSHVPVVIHQLHLCLCSSPGHEEVRWPEPCPVRRLLVEMVVRWRAGDSGASFFSSLSCVGKNAEDIVKCLRNMTVFNQENVEEFYEFGEELGR